MFKIDQVSKILLKAEKKLIKERESFKEFYYIIEKYAFNNPDLILGGTMGINLLLKKKRSLDDYFYDFYSIEAYKHAINLSNLLSEKSILVVMRTIIPYRQFVINVEERNLINIYTLYNINKIEKVIDPLVAVSYEGFQISILPPEIQLINIYRTLYSPNLSSEWELSLKNENKLFIHLQERLGAAENILEKRIKIQEEIITSYLYNNKDIVLIGDHAFSYLRGIISETPIIQIITSIPIDEIIKNIGKIAERILKKNVVITQYERFLYIMDDFRIRRNVIKMGKKEKEVMYVYNSSQFELIPFNILEFKTGNFLQIGNPFVLFRFILIDLWILKLLLINDIIDFQYMKKRYNDIILRLLTLRKQLSKVSSEISTITEQNIIIFPQNKNQYIGQYQNDLIATKLMTKKIKFPDYYPIFWKSKYGKYKS